VTEVERLILQGLDIMMRTQQMPRGPGALEEHCTELSRDMDEWGRDVAVLTSKREEP
jgi:hypothetical protein